MAQQQHIAFIGFGEAAQTFLKGWDRVDTASSHVAHPLRAFDIKTEEALTREAKLAEYSTFQVEGSHSIAATLSHADIVFSLVTADQAGQAAQQVAENIQKPILFFDGNSCSPATKKQNAQLIEAAGGLYIDMAIMAPVATDLSKTPILLCGEHAEMGHQRLSQLGMTVSIVEGEIGTASAMKMIRSVMIKGMEALTAECLLAAKQAGIDDYVLASLDKSFPSFNWHDKAGYNLERMALHGRRRAAEMREVARTLSEIGMANAMTTATVEWQQAIGDLALAPETTEFKQLSARILNKLNK